MSKPWQFSCEILQYMCSDLIAIMDPDNCLYVVQDGRDLLHAAAISGSEELVHMLVEDYTLAPGFSTVNTSLYCHIFTPCTVESLCVYIVYTIKTQLAVLHREMSLMHGPILYTVLCMWLV